MSSPPPSSIEAEREYENLLQVVIPPLFQLPAEPTERDIKEARERIPQIIKTIQASKYEKYLLAPYPNPSPTKLLNDALTSYLDIKAEHKKAAKEAQQKAARAEQEKELEDAIKEAEMLKELHKAPPRPYANPDDLSRIYASMANFHNEQYNHKKFSSSHEGGKRKTKRRKRRKQRKKTKRRRPKKSRKRRTRPKKRRTRKRRK
jgi:hypothetical protein